MAKTLEEIEKEIEQKDQLKEQLDAEKKALKEEKKKLLKPARDKLVEHIKKELVRLEWHQDDLAKALGVKTIGEKKNRKPTVYCRIFNPNNPNEFCDLKRGRDQWYDDATKNGKDLDAVRSILAFSLQQPQARGDYDRAIKRVKAQQEKQKH